MHRTRCTRCLNLLLTYPEGCRAVAPIAGSRATARLNATVPIATSSAFDWPAVPYDQVIELVAGGGDGDVSIACASARTTHRRLDADTRNIQSEVGCRACCGAGRAGFHSVQANPDSRSPAQDVQVAAKDLGADIFTVAVRPVTAKVFYRTRGRCSIAAQLGIDCQTLERRPAEVFGPERFGAHLIVGMGESDHDVLTQSRDPRPRRR